MTLLLKAPDAVLDYQVDWSEDYLSGDVLTDSRWSVLPDDPGALQIVASTFDFGTASVQIGGGEAGKLYRLTNHVSTSASQEDSRSVIVRMEVR